MVIRLDLEKAGCRVSHLPMGSVPRDEMEFISRCGIDAVPEPPAENPDDPDDPDQQQSDLLPGLEYSFRSEAVSDFGAYSSPMYAHPVVSVGMQVPEGDMDTLHTWLGATTTGPVVPSDTLVRRMTNALFGAMQGYLTGMTRAGYFTRPFRIAVALKLSNGKHLLLGAPRLIVPNATAPLMLIRERALSGNSFATLTEVINTPMSLTVDVSPFTLTDDALAQVVSLDIIATRQADFLDGDEQVTALRTYSYMGENFLGWYYSAPAEDEVRRRAESDESFRVLRSLPIADAMAGMTGVEVPTAGASLENWAAFAAVTLQSADDTDTPALSDDDYEFIRIDTDALDLGYPEVHKLIRAVSLRGIFHRRGSGNTERESWLALYGSHHRDVWHKVAISRGPHIAGLRGVRYRWLRLAIAGPRNSLYDALTFHLG